MGLLQEIREIIRIQKGNTLRDIKILPEEIEKLKTTIFDYWGRNIQKTIDSIKSEPGQKAFVWGGESPREPLKITTKLVMSGFNKIIFMDQLSHLFGRDNIISTSSILDKSVLYVYKKHFITEAIKQYIYILFTLNPLIESGIVEILPPPLFWNDNFRSFIEDAVGHDISNPNYLEFFQKGIQYDIKGKPKKLNYCQVKELFLEYNLSIKNEKYIRNEYKSIKKYADITMSGPAAEINEALFIRSYLASKEFPHEVSLITDINRHWEWLEWKLGQDLSLEHELFKFEKINIPFLDEVPAEILAEAKSLDIFDDIRNFLKAEFFELIKSNNQENKLLKNEWEVKHKIIQNKINELKKSYFHQFSYRLSIIPFVVLLGIPKLVSFPEWIAQLSQIVGTYTLRDLWALYGSFKSDKKALLKEFPLYTFIQEKNKRTLTEIDTDMLIIDTTYKKYGIN